jgi:hypothetical protein
VTVVRGAAAALPELPDPDTEDTDRLAALVLAAGRVTT